MSEDDTEGLTVGDLLEWLAALAFVAAAWKGVGVALALAVAGGCLVYFAQCYDSEIPSPGEGDAWYGSAAVDAISRRVRSMIHRHRSEGDS